ncbi:hypothetical protein C0033_07465 [Clostridium sp. chh4-2]|uniref:DUF5048 domain-containing protein n=1 Tax=Clostridium sp. chh4-2 TaxID=2067550 RepID=UPI000CCF979E|nr:DUF5048 domain-containing protein [Clostridium sp. chh4-2]PNV62847.1 hypothetical protein C0033_07465 [Clostridium sp. chh4-2]
MAYDVTQTDLNLLKQSTQEIFLKVELLNQKYKILDSLEGVIINDNFSVNNDSVQRRSYTCDLHVTDSSFMIGSDKKIWLDKKLRVYYGIKSLRENKIIWYRIGTFVYVSMNYKYSQTERTLSLTCADLMAEYDGTLNGQLAGYDPSAPDSEDIAHKLTIPAGQDIRTSVISLLKTAQIENYFVEDIKKEVPYDLEFNTGTTYCEIWTKLRDLYDAWEFFFDADGTFIWREIPNCLTDNISFDDSLLQNIVIDESASLSFDNIYNVTEVWGKVLELENKDCYAKSSVYTGNVYHINFDFYSSWDDIDHLTQIAVKICSDNLDSPQFSINNYSPIPIFDGNGNPLKANSLKSDTTYVFRYRRLTADESGISSALFLLGQYQCYGKYVETSDLCPFSVQNLGYEIAQSLDYDTLSDDAACYNQAEYLTYSTTAMMDTLTLTTLVIPWLEVNTKVEYTPKYSNEKNQYIIKSFSWSTGAGTMTLTLYKFLESFSFVSNRRNQNKNKEGDGNGEI